MAKGRTLLEKAAILTWGSFIGTQREKEEAAVLRAKALERGGTSLRGLTTGAKGALRDAGRHLGEYRQAREHTRGATTVARVALVRKDFTNEGKPVSLATGKPFEVLMANGYRDPASLVSQKDCFHAAVIALLTAGSFRVVRPAIHQDLGESRAVFQANSGIPGGDAYYAALSPWFYGGAPQQGWHQPFAVWPLIVTEADQGQVTTAALKLEQGGITAKALRAERFLSVFAEILAGWPKKGTFAGAGDWASVDDVRRLVALGPMAFGEDAVALENSYAASDPLSIRMFAYARLPDASMIPDLLEFCRLLGLDLSIRVELLDVTVEQERPGVHPALAQGYQSGEYLPVSLSFVVAAKGSTRPEALRWLAYCQDQFRARFRPNGALIKVGSSIWSAAGRMDTEDAFRAGLPVPGGLPDCYRVMATSDAVGCILKPVGREIVGHSGTNVFLGQEQGGDWGTVAVHDFFPSRRRARPPEEGFRLAGKSNNAIVIANMGGGKSVLERRACHGLALNGVPRIVVIDPLGGCWRVFMRKIFPGDLVELNLAEEDPDPGLLAQLVERETLHVYVNTGGVISHVVAERLIKVMDWLAKLTATHNSSRQCNGALFVDEIAKWVSGGDELVSKLADWIRLSRNAWWAFMGTTQTVHDVDQQAFSAVIIGLCSTRFLGYTSPEFKGDLMALGFSEADAQAACSYKTGKFSIYPSTNGSRVIFNRLTPELSRLYIDEE